VTFIFIFAKILIVMCQVPGVTHSSVSVML